MAWAQNSIYVMVIMVYAYCKHSCKLIRLQTHFQNILYVISPCLPPSSIKLAGLSQTLQVPWTWVPAGATNSQFLFSAAALRIEHRLVQKSADKKLREKSRMRMAKSIVFLYVSCDIIVGSRLVPSFPGLNASAPALMPRLWVNMIAAQVSCGSAAGLGRRGISRVGRRSSGLIIGWRDDY